MTNIEMRLSRMHNELLSLEILFTATARALQESSPVFARSLRQLGNTQLQSFQQLAIPGQTAEQSDLHSAEFQEAFEALLQRVLLPVS